MELFIWILHILIAASMVGLVLLQHGKGADMGAAFGSGSSGSLFGATGSANFLSRSTAVLATVFFMTSLGLTFLSAQQKPLVAAPIPVTTQPAGSPAPAAPGDAAADKAGAIPK